MALSALGGGGVSSQGCVSGPGGCLLPVGCLVRWGGGVCSRGVSGLPGGVWSGLPGGSALPGGLVRGGWCIPACTEADTLPPVDRILDTRL